MTTVFMELFLSYFRYNIWNEGRDFGPHPEDPQEIKELYENINLQNPNEEEEKVGEKRTIC